MGVAERLEHREHRMHADAYGSTNDARRNGSAASRGDASQPSSPFSVCWEVPEIAGSRMAAFEKKRLFAVRQVPLPERAGGLRSKRPRHLEQALDGPALERCRVHEELAVTRRRCSKAWVASGVYEDEAPPRPIVRWVLQHREYEQVVEPDLLSSLRTILSRQPATKTLDRSVTAS